MKHVTSFEYIRFAHRVVDAALASAIHHAQSYSTGSVRDDRSSFHAFVGFLVERFEAEKETAEALDFFMKAADWPMALTERLSRVQERVEAASVVVVRALEDSKRLFADPTSAARLEKSLRDFDGVWRARVELFDATMTEEAVRAHVTPEAEATFLGELADRAEKRGDYEPARLAFFMYNLPEADRRAFKASMPWHVTNVMVPFIWRDKWRNVESYFAHRRVA